MIDILAIRAHCEEAKTVEYRYWDDAEDAKPDMIALCDEVDRLRAELTRWEYWAEYGKWPKDAEATP